MNTDRECAIDKNPARWVVTMATSVMKLCHACFIALVGVEEIVEAHLLETERREERKKV